MPGPPAIEGQPEIEAEEFIPPPSPPARPAVRPPVSGPPAALNASVTVLPGVGPRHGQTLARLGLHNLNDMLYYFPRRYDDYTQLKPINRLFYGEEVTIIGTIENLIARPIRSGRVQMSEAVVSDGTGRAGSPGSTSPGSPGACAPACRSRSLAR
jgi:ATP-dependent DNA helicase RecG